MKEYELVYTVRMVIEAESQDDATDKAHELLKEIAWDYDLETVSEY